MTTLTHQAKAALRDAGVSQAAWTRRYSLDGKWHGDRCGCPDDHCIGYHHDDEDDCQCLPALLGTEPPWSN